MSSSSLISSISSRQKLGSSSEQVPQKIRADLIIGVYLAWGALGITHMGVFWLYPEYWVELRPYIWAFYLVFGLSYIMSRWAPIQLLLPFELLSSGLHAYVVCAIGGSESQMHLLFVIMAMRCYLLFPYNPSYVWLSYSYYSLLLVLGYFSEFALPPGIELPEISPEIRSFLGGVVVLGQAPIMLVMIQAAIQRTRKERDQYYRIEKESARLEAQLERQGELQRLIFEQSFDAQFLVEDRYLRILDCNQQAVLMFQGRNKKDFIGRRGFDFGFKFWDRRQLFEAKHDLDHLGHFRGEFEYRTLRGRRFWGVVAIRRFAWENQNYLIVRIADITKLKADQAALQQKNKELERYIASNLQLENFAYMASHDLKEPLRSIVAFAQLLQRRYSDQLDGAGQEFVQHIVTAGQNLDQLIRALLSYSRVQSEEVKMHTLDLPELLAEVMRDLGPLIREKGAIIEIDPELPHELLGDAVRLRQLWQNLLTNALKFHRKGKSPEIAISGWELDDGWGFFVSDRGIGIAHEDREKVFLLFKRLHGKQAYQGTGIGLALCRRIVQQHNGTIWIETPEDGVGTRFCFELKTSRPKVKLPL